jgi:hypothetical protein
MQDTERVLNACKILARKSGVKRPLCWEYVYFDERVVGKLFIQSVKI